MTTQPNRLAESTVRWLEDVEPGLELAGWLMAYSDVPISGYDRIAVLRAHQRMASHYAAQVLRDMAEVSAAFVAEDGVNVQSADEYAAAEIRAALRLTRRSADAELSFALDLQRRLPQVFESLASGHIDVRRAKVFDRYTIDLPITTARTIVDAVLPDAPNLTTGQLGARLDRLRMEIEPDEAQERYQHAVNDRRVVMEPTPSGTANLYAFDLPPDRASALMKRLNRTARSLRNDGDQRSMDQLRTDVFLDLCTGGPADRNLTVRSTSTSISKRSSPSTTVPVNSQDTARSSPTSRARSPSSRSTVHGVTRSPTRIPDGRCQPEPPVADPPRLSTERS